MTGFSSMVAAKKNPQKALKWMVFNENGKSSKISHMKKILVVSMILAGLFACSDNGNAQTTASQLTQTETQSQTLAANRVTEEIVDANYIKEKADAPHVIIIDVRTPDEYNAGTIPGTDYNIDYRHLGQIKQLDIDPRQDTIVVFCRSGRRAKIAYHALRDMGYKNVKLYAGSLIDWTQQGNELVPPENK